ncbi:MAG: HD domain-containing protein [Nitrospira sp. SB0666_bin_27]|nr:HD domain-containing protein [Nitrospira sp. SB0666_bin_27]MYC28072.1 HD domain-containing protein [Nitrospira sp. SB0662_bin_26]MYF25287.1 HD domain-containing protein [Nitrospira sp. SB0678_bin_10]
MGDASKTITPIWERLSDCDTIEYLVNAMRRHDPALLEHGIRTASYSRVLGRLENLTNNDLEDLYHAALLHDIGKMSLPNGVILQNGISIIGDYLMTECTPRAGADMLRPWPELQNVATLIALHHERWDGMGFPFGLRGRQIPMGARILSLADTVDQLLTQKSDSLSAQATAVVRILRTLSRSRFDPKLVNLFIEWFQDVFLETLVNYPWREDGLVLKSDSTSTVDNIFESAKLIHGIM